MDRFQQLAVAVLVSGSIAGIALFAVQHWTVVRVIQDAEVYEKAADASMPGMAHEGNAWEPADGMERTSFTALATVLTGIGFAAVWFAVISLSGKPLDAGRGLLWGLAAYACVDLAPALGLPPQPPGTAVANLYARQLWWTATVIATAAGLWLLLGKSGTWSWRIGGIVLLILPHLIHVPAPIGSNAAPEALIHRFTLLSIATTGVFWLLLGVVGGYVFNNLSSLKKMNHEPRPFPQLV